MLHYDKRFRRFWYLLKVNFSIFIKSLVKSPADKIISYYYDRSSATVRQHKKRFFFNFIFVLLISVKGLQKNF